MEKQEVKSILDRLFELSLIAKEKKHYMFYSYNSTYNSINMFYCPGQYPGGPVEVVNENRLLDVPYHQNKIIDEINLIESHLNS